MHRIIVIPALLATLALCAPAHASVSGAASAVKREVRADDKRVLNDVNCRQTRPHRYKCRMDVSDPFDNYRIYRAKATVVQYGRSYEVTSWG